MTNPTKLSIKRIRFRIIKKGTTIAEAGAIRVTRIQKDSAPCPRKRNLVKAYAAVIPIASDKIVDTKANKKLFR